MKRRIKKINPVAQALRTPAFRPTKTKDKTKYDRKQVAGKRHSGDYSIAS